MNALGICGSLRQNSSNWAILKAAQSYLNHLNWEILNLSELPYFDPDNQFTENTPDIVKKMRQQAAEADFLFISTPEYAHGAPGILKNALEWIFCEETMHKPVALIIGSSQGESTKSQLLDILTTMDFKITEKEILLIKGARSKIDISGNFFDPSLKQLFENFCSLFIFNLKS